MIKPFHLKDVILVAQLQKKGISLDLEERLLHPRSPLRSALLANAYPITPQVATYIIDGSNENEPYQGLAQSRVRPGRPEQDIVFLAPAPEHGNGSLAIWQRLLNHVCIKAGETGHQRIYARLGANDEALKIFKNVGFSAYAEEHIFQLDPDLYLPAAKEPLLEVRRQKDADSWSLQRLYAAVTPRPVQIAEGLAQGQWQINNYLLGDQGFRHGYVWVNQGEIPAVLNFHSGKAGHWFRLMVHPDATDDASNLMMSGLRLIKDIRRYPVYCSLRTYQSEFVPRLLDCGFRQIATQIVLVKHITIRAKDFLTRLVPTPVEAKHATPTAMVQADTTPTATTNGHSKRTPGLQFE